MERLLALQTGSNENGVLALSNENTCYLAFPSGPLGGVVLYDCISLRLLNQLDAHKNAICAVEFNNNGQMLATVSTVGTVIRVFGIPSGQHLCSFRRGSTHATVHSLSFCPDSCFLLVGSSTGTIHIFSVEESLHKADGTGAGALASSHPSTATSSSRTQSVDSNSNTTTSGAATSAVSSLTSYIGAAQSWGLAVVGGLHIFPEPVQEYADSARAKVKARIPEADASSPYRVAIVSSHASSSSDCGKGSETPASSSAGRLEVVAVTATKRLYRYTVPLPVPPTVDGSPFVCSVDDEAVLEC